jgi:hypothetical protein
MYNLSLLNSVLMLLMHAESEHAESEAENRARMPLDVETLYLLRIHPLV